MLKTKKKPGCPIFNPITTFAIQKVEKADTNKTKILNRNIFAFLLTLSQPISDYFVTLFYIGRLDHHHA